MDRVLSTDIPELETIAYSWEDIAYHLHKISALVTSVKLQSLAPGEPVTVATDLGPFTGEYVGTSGALSDMALTKSASGYVAENNDYSDSVIIKTSGEHGAVIDSQGSVHTDWLIIPKEFVTNVIREVKQDG